MESSAQMPLADITEPNWLMQDRKYISCYMANYSCKDEALMQAVVDEFREAGCPMPKLEMLEAELRFLEADV